MPEYYDAREAITWATDYFRNAFTALEALRRMEEKFHEREEDEFPA